MITVACVEHGGYMGHPQEYVAKLRSMVARHVSGPHRFVCLTDDPTRHPGIECQQLPSREKDGLSGWWAKCYYFSPGRFEDRVLALDLDTLITGPLDALVEHKGIIHLARWGWAKNDYGSGVMVFDAGEHEKVWKRYTAAVPHRFRGDQDWITWLGGWDALPDGLCVSYRYHCKDGVPPGASVVCFHGEKDKPHLMPDEHWTRKYWQ